MQDFPPIWLMLYFQRGWVWNGAHQFRVAEGLPALWPQLRQKVGVTMIVLCQRLSSNSSRLGETEINEQDTGPNTRQME
jgi:hypothetical protein